MTGPRLLAPLLLAVLGAAACVPPSRPAAPRPASYDELLGRLKGGDTTVDFTALRLAYAASPEYAPYGSDAGVHRDSMRAALARRDYRRVLREADAALTIDYLDLRTHVARALAAEELGDTVASHWDRFVAAHLMRSILQSGAGTAESPYVVISVAEEYAVVGISGYESGQQGLGDCGTRPCDILQATHHTTGEKRTFHFDISLPKGFMERLNTRE